MTGHNTPFARCALTAAACALFIVGPARAIDCDSLPVPELLESARTFQTDRPKGERVITALFRWSPKTSAASVDQARYKWRTFTRHSKGTDRDETSIRSASPVTGSSEVIAVVRDGKSRDGSASEIKPPTAVKVFQMCPSTSCPDFPRALISPEAAEEVWVMATRPERPVKTEPAWTVTPAVCGGRVVANPGPEEKGRLNRWLEKQDAEEAR